MAKNYLSSEVDSIYHSIIVFSEHCTLKIELQTRYLQSRKKKMLSLPIKTIIENTSEFTVLSDTQIILLFKNYFR